MTDRHHVLCVSTDAETLATLTGPLEGGDAPVAVLGAHSFDDAIQYLSTDDLDAVVTDAATVQSAPAVVEAARERHPDLPFLLVTRSDDGAGTALADVSAFTDPPGTRSTDEPYRDWVVDSVTAGDSRHGDGEDDSPEAVVSDVKRGLVDATSPLDIEHAVCERLTDVERYPFAWIGEYDRGERHVVPWVTAAAVDDWPTSRTFPVGTDDGETLVDRALATRDPQFAGDVDGTVPWADAARDHGCAGVAVVPLVSEDDDLYGVLGVYTRDPDGFDERERAALATIATTTARVLRTMALSGTVDQQERALERYERLVETVADGMYVLDEEGHFTTVNDGLTEMTGYAREGMLGEHVSLILADDGSLGDDAVRDLLDGHRDETRTLETELETKGGERIPAETKIALHVDDDTFRGTVGVARDITERKQRERELRRQNERLEQFASIVSHDLRNPLSVAQGYLELAMEDPTAADLEDVAGALERMEDIIEDVLALAREGKTVTATDPVEFASAVEDAWATVETGAATLEIAATATVAADRSRLRRLLENLFRNAVEHGGEAVTVTAGVERRPDEGEDIEGSYRFYVADDGAGIPPELRESLFDAAFTTSEEGLGLGLWVVREIATAHGWSTSAKESADGGARFEFGGVSGV